MKKFVSLAAVAASLAAAPAFAATTPEEVDAWVKQADKAYFDETVKAGQTAWVYETYIMQDSEAIAADANAKMAVLQVDNAAKAAEMAKVPGLSADTQRRLNMFRTLIVAPVPSTPGAAGTVAVTGALAADKKASTRSRNPDMSWSTSRSTAWTVTSFSSDASKVFFR